MKTFAAALALFLLAGTAVESHAATRTRSSRPSPGRTVASPRSARPPQVSSRLLRPARPPQARPITAFDAGRRYPGGIFAYLNRHGNI